MILDDEVILILLRWRDRYYDQNLNVNDGIAFRELKKVFGADENERRS